MDTADQLVEQMFSWMEQREECANKLEKLARELESLREKCNAFRALGTTVAVTGVLSFIGAGVATVFTAGAASPLLSVAAMCTGTGVGINLITELVEHLMESDTMKDAKEVESKANDITNRIQRLFQQLKEECEKASFDDQDQHAMTEIVGAIAKRSGLDPHSIKDIFQQYFSWGGPETMDVNMISLEPTLVELAGVLTFFSVEASGEQSKILFAKGADQMIKIVSEAGILAVFRKIVLAVVEAIGMAFDLPEAINHWKNLIEKNNVTEANKSLKDTADALRKLNRILRAQLDKIKKLLEKFHRLKCYIENKTCEEKENVIRIVKKICHEREILNYLKTTDDTEVFFKLVGIFHLLKQELDKKKKKTDQENIDIIFVAHGAIKKPLIPARTLLPLSTIKDVILYSPWNCTIDANVAYGIATGHLETQDTIFCCGEDDCCSDADSSRHQPRSLPQNWNSMKNAGGSMIPNIFVSPLKYPEDGAWERVVFLEGKFGEPGRNRVVIPYIIPGYDGGDSMTIPFCLVTLALSVVLFIFPFTARVHLAACLSRSSKKTQTEQSEYLEQQYSWTIDKTHMTVKTEDLEWNSKLYKALRAVFDR